jgi:hypothetical protein
MKIRESYTNVESEMPGPTRPSGLTILSICGNTAAWCFWPIILAVIERSTSRTLNHPEQQKWLQLYRTPSHLLLKNELELMLLARAKLGDGIAICIACCRYLLCPRFDRESGQYLDSPHPGPRRSSGPSSVKLAYSLTELVAMRHPVPSFLSLTAWAALSARRPFCSREITPKLIFGAYSITSKASYSWALLTREPGWLTGPTYRLRLLKILETDDQFLESIRELREGGRRLEVTCFFEELPLPVVGKVVSKESATLEGYNPISIRANHRDMVKFGSAEDNGFKRLLGELIRWEGQVRYSVSCEPTQSIELC